MPKKRNGTSLFSLLSVILSWVFMSHMFVMFYFACFSPSNQLLIDTNAYGEMWVEVVIFGFIWIMTTVNLVLLLRRQPRVD